MVGSIGSELRQVAMQGQSPIESSNLAKSPIGCHVFKGGIELSMSTKEIRSELNHGRVWMRR